jgi:predicted dehydrogenase
MTEPGQDLHIGLVGCGRWGRLILRDLKSLGCRVSAADPSDAGKQFARECGAEPVGSIEELPRSIDGAIVATPTVLHADSIDRLLPRGIPIFTEKALTADPVEARRLAAAAPDRIFVMDKWRYHPGIERLGAIAKSEELGPVRNLSTTRHSWGTVFDDIDAVRLLVPHDLSIVLEILGFIPDPVSAAAHEEDGEPLQVSAILGKLPWVSLSVSARHPRNQRAVTLSCAGGTAMLEDGYASEIVIKRVVSGKPSAADPLEKCAVADEMPLLRELRAFLGHLRGGPPPRSSVAEGARTVEVLDRICALAGLRAYGS